MEKNHIKLCICIAAAIIGVIFTLAQGAYFLNTGSSAGRQVLFLDPGHGGMDGGAVSSRGVPEKDINLAIAMELKDLAEEYGWRVIMTRETDQWLADGTEGSIRSMKTQDLKARSQMLMKYEPQVAVSIHLNSFKEDPSVNGVQVFFPDEGGSEKVLTQCEEFAGVLQDNIAEETDSQHKRVPMVRDGVFLFREVICPIAIVECGFLSNPQEARLLQTRKYQRILAQGIMDGINEYTGVEKEVKGQVIDSLAKKDT